MATRIFRAGDAWLGICYAVLMAIVPPAGATLIHPGPLAQGDVPVIRISILDGPTPPTWQYSPALELLGAPQRSNSGWGLTTTPAFDILSNRAHVQVMELEFDPDPFVLNNLLVTNTTASTQIYSVTVGLPTSLAAPNAISGNISTTVIDGGADGATVASVAGTAIYSAQIDFATVATLQNDPFSLVAPAAGNNNAAASFGPLANAIPVTSSIGIQLRFSLTAGDTASILSRFDVVVPEPGSLAVSGLAIVLLCTTASRRR